MDPFADATIAITGAASGIGRALATRLAALGARLGLGDVDLDGVTATRDAIRAAGGRAEAWKVDVTSVEQVQAWVDALEGELGPTDILFNNAGVSLVDQVVTQSLDDMHWIMSINFWGVVHGVKAVLPGMRERGRGHIVNISSLFGLLGASGQSAYNASKFAVRGFTEALRQEERGHGIVVTSVHPGGIRTSIARNARFRHGARPEHDHEKLVALFDRVARTSAEDAADVIIAGVRARRPRILVGSDARFMDRVQRLVPGRYDLVLRRLKML